MPSEPQKACDDLQEIPFQRKKDAKELNMDRQSLQSIVEYAPIGLALIDKDGNFCYINPKFRDLFGYDLDEAANGRNWFRRAYPNSPYRHKVISSWINDSKGSRSGEKRPRTFTVTCKDGTEKIIKFVAVKLESGEDLLTCEDVTERNQAEEALQKSEEKYRLLINTAHESVIVVQDGMFKFVNPMTLSLLGVDSEQELIDRPT